jgi:hypothetical protein
MSTLNPDRVRVEWKGPDCEDLILKCDHCNGWHSAQQIAIVDCDACGQEFYVCEECNGLEQAERDLIKHEQAHYSVDLDWYESKEERLAQAG